MPSFSRKEYKGWYLTEVIFELLRFGNSNRVSEYITLQGALVEPYGNVKICGSSFRAIDNLTKASIFFLNTLVVSQEKQCSCQVSTNANLAIT